MFSAPYVLGNLYLNVCFVITFIVIVSVNTTFIVIVSVNTTFSIVHE